MLEVVDAPLAGERRRWHRQQQRARHAATQRRSRAAAGICEWVINIRKYYEVWCEVDPKRKRLAAEAKRLAKKLKADVNQANTRIQERIANIKTVRLAGRDKYEIETYEKAMEATGG